MSSEEVKPKRQRHQDRITLDQESLSRVDNWIEQVTSVAKGVTLSRKDIVNWLVKQHGEAMSSDELNDLKARYFSEVRFLQHAIRELKAARLRGETVRLEEILANRSSSQVKRHRARRKQSVTSSTPENAITDDSHMINVSE